MTLRTNAKLFERIRQGCTVTFMSDVVVPAQHHPVSACLLIAIHDAMAQYPYTNRRVVRTWWGGTRLKQYKRRDIAVATDSHLEGYWWTHGVIHDSKIGTTIRHGNSIESLTCAFTNAFDHETAVMLDLTNKTGVDASVAAWPWPISFSFGQLRPALDGQHVVTVSMNFDRRIMAGAPAAKFWWSVIEKTGELLLKKASEG